MIETIHLQLLLATFAGWVGRQQAVVITYLIEENRVLKEQLESAKYSPYGYGGPYRRGRSSCGRQNSASG